MLKFVTYPGGNNNTWCQDQLNWFSWAECAKDCECLLVGRNFLFLLGTQPPQENESLVRFFRLALGLRKQHRDLLERTTFMTCPDAVGIVSSVIRKVCIGVFSMISSNRVPFGRDFFADWAIASESYFLRCKRSASVRYFCTDWCLEHHRFSDFRIFQNWLATWDAESFCLRYITHIFPLSVHVDTWKSRHQTITWNHDDWESDYNFVSYILHRVYLRIFSVMSGRSGSQQKISKSLCSRVEYDSDKGKGNSNYKHWYIYICIVYIHVYIIQ